MSLFKIAIYSAELGARMKINVEHMYLGAALMQIAESSSFTAINEFLFQGKRVDNVFLINNQVVLYLKYGTAPTANGCYQFNFKSSQLDEVKKIKDIFPKTYMGLVCVEGAEICCIDANNIIDISDQIFNLQNFNKSNDAQALIFVQVAAGSSLRVFANKPKSTKKIPNKPIIIKRKDFPSRLFE